LFGEILKKLKVNLIKGMLFFFGCLPLSVSRWLGLLAGHIAFLINGRSVKVTRKNIEICFPSMDSIDQQRLIKDSFLNTAQLVFEVPVVGSHSLAWAQKKIKNVTGDELLTSAIAKKKGVIILAPHMGNWEVLGLHLSNYGKLTNLYRKPKIAELEGLIKKYRQKGNIHVVPANMRGVASIFNELQKGNLTGILPDQIPDESGGAFAPFFGHPAFTMTFVHKLIQKTHCEVVYGVALRVKGGFDIHYMPVSEAIYSADTDESLIALNKGVEKCVELCPEQYQWEYKRYRKTVNPDDPEVYPY
jgi:KDO2-lipid IV(A) lauroyltransferase